MKKNGSKRSSPRTAPTQLPAAAQRPANPHGHPLTRSKPEDRAHPAERKAKHKRRAGDSE
jgi:hypothetical protein